MDSGCQEIPRLQVSGEHCNHGSPLHAVAPCGACAQTQIIAGPFLVCERPLWDIRRFAIRPGPNCIIGRIARTGSNSAKRSSRGWRNPESPGRGRDNYHKDVKREHVPSTW